MTCKDESYCLYPDCNCSIGANKCVQDGHEDQEIVTGLMLNKWTEDAFRDNEIEIDDNDYPSLDRRRNERRSGLDRREVMP